MSGGYSGVLTSYAYGSASGSTTVAATRGAQTRSKTHDAMGRVTSSTIPEGGTTNYYYDKQSTCPGSVAGQLAKVVDPNGNVLCYSYDSLNRVTKVSGNGTTCRQFYYDSSTGFSGTIPAGITITNSSGRMVEAVTSNCGSTLITDEWTSYDNDGRVMDMWEKTPNSGSSYYHSTTGYFASGKVSSVDMVGQGTATYGVDSKGRWNTLTIGSIAAVTGAAFNSADQMTEMDYGTAADKDKYTFDPNTGRMTNWEFDIGTQSQTAVLSWNANGTLKELNITDGFMSGASQDCKFGASGIMGYDDLGRLLSDNCGSVWSQSFSYDQYDNLTKTGSSSWMPGYSSTNNHYTLGGVTYDANGNVTSDTFHAYGYDEFSKLVSVDKSGTGCATSGECITYDALGRAVEVDSGSTKTEIWFTPLGKTAYMNGGTFLYAYWPLPGGSTLLQLAGGMFQYQHKDWLGNARISSLGGTAIIDDRAFAPYGEMYNNFGSTSANELIFTGDTSNIVPGVLYDTDNRELNPSQGRWLSPDAAGSGWNSYAYGTDPNTQTDPSGLWITGASYQLLNENLRGPFNAGMEIFPGLDQGEYSPVPADTSKLFANYNPSLWIGSGAPGSGLVGINESDVVLPDLAGNYPLFVNAGASQYLNGIGVWFQSQACGGDCSFDMTPLLMVPGVGEAGELIQMSTSLEDLAAGTEAASASGSAAPDFVVTADGTAIPIPEGARGPFDANNELGFQYNGGAGGNGLAPNVTDVRIMDPTADYAGGYVNYGSQQANGGWQTVDPYTGQSVPASSPSWHIPLSLPAP